MSDEIFFNGERYISANEAANSSDLTRDYVARLARDGRVRGKRIGKNWYLDEQSFKTFLVEQEYSKSVRREGVAKERKRERQAFSGSGMQDAPITKIATSVAAGAAGAAAQVSAAAADSISSRARDARANISSASNPNSALMDAVRKINVPAGISDAALRTAHIPLYNVTPVMEFVHKLVALTLAVMITFGTYSLVDPTYAKFAVGSISDEVASAGHMLDASTGGGIPALANRTQSEVALAAENPQLAAAGLADFFSGAIPAYAANLARAVNTRVDALVYSVAFPPNLLHSLAFVSQPSGSVQVSIEPYARPAVTAPVLAAASTAPRVSSPANVIERVIVEPAPSASLAQAGGVTEDELNAKLQQLKNSLTEQISSASAAQSTVIAQNYNVTSQSNAIDNLSSVSIENPTITGGSISGADISASSLSVSGDTSLGSTTIASLNVSTNATTTFSGGIALTGGCVTVNGTCLGTGGGGAGNPGGSATEIQFNDYGSFNGSSLFTFSTSTSQLSVLNASTTNATSTNFVATNATTTNFAVIGLGTTTFAGGIALTSGCVTVNGTCLGTGSGSGASTTLFADNNTFSGSNVFTASTTFSKVVNLANASSTLTTLGTTWFSGISNSILSTNANGQVVGSTTVGTNLLTGSLGTINGSTFSAGGALTISAASSTLLGDNNTFSGSNIFSGNVTLGFGTTTTLFSTTASSTNLFSQSASVGALTLPKTPNALLSTNSSGQVVATSSIGSNLLLVPVNSILAGNSTGQLVASTTIGTNLLSANTISGVTLGGTLANLSVDSTLTGSAYNGSATQTFGINLNNSNSWTASTTFTKVVNLANASSSLTTLGTTWIPSITNSLLSTNASGQLVASTTIGTNLLTGALGTINGSTFSVGGAITVAAASSSLLGDNNTFSGTNTFSNNITLGFGTTTTLFSTTASSTNLFAQTGSIGTLNLDSLVSAILSTNASGQVVATSTIGSNLLSVPADSLLAGNSSGHLVATTTIGNSLLINGGALTVSAGAGLSGGGSVALGGSVSLSLNTTNPNTWTGLQIFSGGASSTLFSAYGPAYFGGTATSSFSTGGVLSLGTVHSCGGSEALQTDTSGNVFCGSVSTGGASTGGGWTSSGDAINGVITNSTSTYVVAVGATTTPYSKLTVVSDNNSTTTLTLVPAAAQTADNLDIYAAGGPLTDVFTAAGFLGVGTSSPGSTLSVGGATYITGTTTVGGNFSAKQATTTNLAITNVPNALLSTNANGSVVATTTIGANLLLVPANSILAGNASGQLVASTTIGTNLLSANTIAFSSPNSTLSVPSTIALGAAGNFDINLNNSNSWTASTTFTKVVNLANASSSLTTLGTTWIPSITNSLLSTNASGQLVASTTIGTNLLTGALGTINGSTFSVGGAITVAAASSSLLGDNNTFSGANTFGTTTLANATSSAFAITSLAGKLLSTNANGSVIATSTIGANYLLVPANSLLAGNASGQVVASTTIGWNLFTGVLGIGQGGTNASSQTSNGVTFFNGNSITSGTNLTFGGNSLLVGTSTPLTSAALYVTATTSQTGTNLLFTVASSTGSSLFNINGNGAITQSGGASSTFSNGINFTTGCVTYNGGPCITIGSSASTTLLGDNNTFIGTNTFSNNITLGFATTTALFSTTASSTNLFAQTASLGTLNLTKTPNALLSTNSSGQVVATTTIGTNLLSANTTNFTSSDSSLTVPSSIALGGTGSFVLNLNNSNSWTASTTFTKVVNLANASSTLNTFATVWLPSISASSLLATDATGKLIASSTIGANLITAGTFGGSGTYNFPAGIFAPATSTIGDGTQAGGLTISGGATTTLNAYFGGNVGIGTSTSASLLALAGGNFTQTPGTPVLIGQGATASSTGAVYIQGHYAYMIDLTSGPSSLQIYDIANPSSPTLVGAYYNVGEGIQDVVVSGKYAYLDQTQTDGGIKVLDISNPANPVLVSNVAACDPTTNDEACGRGGNGMVISGKYAYVGAQSSSGGIININDISNPTMPVLVGSIGTGQGGTGSTISVSGKYAYVAGNQNTTTLRGLNIVDVSNPTAPIIVGTASTTANARAIYVSGKYAYVGELSNVMQIFDISNPAAPVAVGSFTANGVVGAVNLAGHYAYLLELVAIGGLQVVDVSNPSNPVAVASANFASTPGTSFGHGIVVSGKYAYVGDTGATSNGFLIFDISGINAPAATIGNINTSDLTVDENTNIGGDLFINGGINAGISGIFSRGGISAYVASSTQTNPVAANFAGGNVGIGTTSPGFTYRLDTWGAGTGGFFGVSSTTRGDIFNVSTAGNVGIGTTTPGSLLSLGSLANFTAATSTFYSSGGINLTSGCFSINNTCIGGSGSSASSTLLSDNNTFSGNNIFSAPLVLSSTSGTTTIASGQGFTIGGSQFVVQQGSGNVGIGTTNPNVQLTINGTGAGTLPTPPVGTGLELVGGKNLPGSDIALFKYIGTPTITLAQASGTPAVPVAITAGRLLSNLNSEGYDGSAFATGAQNVVQAEDNWSTSDHATLFEWFTTPKGSSAFPNSNMVLYQGLYVGGGADTGGNADPGRGSIHATANISASSTLTIGGLATLQSGLISQASSTVGDGTFGLTITGAATTTGNAYFAGNVGIGTTTPGSLLSLGSLANFTTATSTFYSTGGINLTSGCFAVGSNCLSLSNLGGIVPIANGGTNQSSQTTNGVNYFDGTHITSGSALTFDGTTFSTPLFNATQTSGTSTIASGQGFTIGGSQFVVQQGSGNVGIGTTSPPYLLTVDGGSGSFLAVNGNGVGIDTSPVSGTLLSISTSTTISTIGENIKDTYVGAASVSIRGLNSTAVWQGTANDAVTGLGGLAGGLFTSQNNSTGMNVALQSGVSSLINIAGTLASTTDGVDFYAQGPSVSSGRLLTNFKGLYVTAAAEFASALTNQAGIDVANLTAATNNTEALLGTATIPSGNYGLYQADTNNNYFGGNVGIGTTSPTNKLEVAGNSFFGGNLTATGTVSFTGATTTAANGINLTAGCFAVNGTCLPTTNASSTLLGDNNTFSGNNVFSSLLKMTSGLLATASSTIGDSTQTGGLTINGGATTTANAYFASNVGIGGQPKGSFPLYVNGSEFLNGTLDFLGTDQDTISFNSGSAAGLLLKGGNVYGAKLTNADLRFDQNIALVWTNGTSYSGSPDTGVSRISANKVGVGNGTLGDFSGTLAVGTLGIGTSSPSYALETVGAGRFTSFVDASYFVATSSTATSTLAGALTVGGSQFVVQQGSGNVGIGTSSPAATFAVNGSTFLTGGPLLQTISSTPVIKGTLTDSTHLGGAIGEDVQGRYAYVAGTNLGWFLVIDITDPGNPVTVGTVQDLTKLAGAEYVRVEGKYAYVTANSGNRLTIIDISNPAAPTIVGSVNDATKLSGVRGLYVSGKYAYVTAQSTNRFTVIDVSNPAAPVIVGSIADATNLANADGVYVVDHYVYVAAGNNNEITIIDVSNPTAPVIVGDVVDVANLGNCHEIQVFGKYAYAACQNSNSLTVLDISSSTAPTVVGEVKDSTNLGAIKALSVDGRYAYVTSNSNNRLTVVDISSSTAPKVISSLQDSTNLGSARDVFVSGRYAYVVANNKFNVVDVGGADLATASIGNLGAQQISSFGNASIGNDLDVRHGLNVGYGGIQSNGSLLVQGQTGDSPFSVLDSSGNQLLLLNSSGNFGIGTSSPGSLLSVGNTNGINFGTATSTFSTTGGINLTAGCFSINGTCVGGSSGSSASSTLLSDNNTFSGTNIFSNLLTMTNGLIASASSTIGNGTQTGGLTINGGATTTLNAYFAGNVGIGTTSPGTLLSVGNATGINFSTATSSFSTTGGVNLAAGCYAINGTCVANASLIAIETLTTSGTWSRPAGVTAVEIVTTGGGAGGGSGSGTANWGNGGGAGGTAIAYANVASVSSVSYTVGGAGGGGSGTSVAGTNGGATSFGSYSAANGGTGGPATGSNLGGAGGTATTGSVLLTGGDGVSGGANANFKGGNGGGSYWGGGGTTQTNGSVYGAGGGGGTSAVNGGNGAGGVIVLYEYGNANTAGSNVAGTAGQVQFNLAGSTLGASSNFFWDNTNARLGLGTTTPGSLLSLGSLANFTTATSTFYSTGGINLTAGCFAVNGTCISGSGSSASSTLLSDNNTFSGTNVFSASTTFTKVVNLQNASTTFATLGTTWFPNLTASRLLALDNNGQVIASSTVGVNFLTGVLPVANGGTGAASLSGLLQGNGSSAITGVAGTAGQIPYYNGTNTLLATSTILLANSSNVAIGPGASANNLLQVGNGAANMNVGFAFDNPNAAMAIFGVQDTNNTQNGISLEFGTNNASTSALFIQRITQDVGIGTTSPSGTFAVAGSTFLGGNLTATGTVNFTGATTTAANGFNISAGCFAVNGTCVGSGSASLTGSTGQVAYFSGTNSAVGTSSLFISTAGNVGIGTTNPTSLLTLAGTGGTAAVIASTTDVTTGSIASLQARSDASIFSFASHGSARTVTRDGITLGGWNEIDSFNNLGTNNGLLIDTIGAAPIVFGTNGSENLRIASGGNVGVGTTSPFALLSLNAVNGSANTTLFNISSSTLANTATTSLLSFSNTGQLTIGSNSSPVSTSAQLSILAGTTTITRASQTTLSAGGFFGNSSDSVYVQGRYAYIVEGESTSTPAFEIFDVSNPNAPARVSQTTINGNDGDSISVQGKYAYIITGGSNTNTFEVYDVSNPAAPVLTGQTNTQAFDYSSLYAAGRYVYVAIGGLGSHGFEIFDVSNPSAPVQVGDATLAQGAVSADGISVQGRYAYIVEGSGATNNFEVFDISNPATPLRVSQSTLANYANAGNGGDSIFVSGRYAYIAEGGNLSVSNVGFEIYDISNPASPSRVSQTNLNRIGQTDGIFVSGRYAYIAEGNGTTNAFEVFDISNPAAPSRVSQNNLAQGSGSGGGDGIFVSGRYAYIAEGSGKTNAFEIFDLGGAYVQQLEAGGLEAGTLVLRNNLSAVDGNFSGALTVGSSLTVNGSASILSATTTFGTTANIFNIATASSTNSIFSVLGNGNIGLGTTTPWARLSVDTTNLTTGEPEFLVGSSTRNDFVITQAGFVGLGISNPSSIFEIQGSSSAAYAGSTVPGTPRIKIINNDTTNSNTAALTFATFDLAGANTSAAAITSVFTSHTTNAVSGDLAFQTKNAGTLAEAMRITAAGNVGIGTTTPFASLSIQKSSGNAFSISNSVGSTTLQVSTQDTSNNIFEVASSTGTAYLDITSGGNVGIGTTSPKSTFAVVGSGCFSVGGSATLSCGTTAGNLYYSAANTGNYDVAEDYVTTDLNAKPGTIVALAADSEQVATATSSANVLGVVSTNPGLILGGADASTAGEKVIPIALSGRVPVNISSANGPIEIGDRLALSTTTPGVAVKALETGETIGIALEDATSSMVDVFVQPQFIVAQNALNVLSGLASSAATSSPSTIASSFFSSASAALQEEISSIGSAVVHVFQDAVYAATGIFNKIYAQEVHTDKLCVSDSTGETCITKAQLDALLAGAAGSQSGSSSSGGSSGNSDAGSTPDSGSSPQAPVLQISGANPATVSVGTVYNDLGATITGLVGDTNLGIQVFVDGGATTTPDQIQIDTSAAGTHTIVYSVTDQNGLTGTATRTVNVVQPTQASSPDTSNSDATSTDSSDASSTAATSTTP